jgi:hypothetical protein
MTLQDWKIFEIDNPKQRVSFTIRLRIRQPARPKVPPYAEAVEITWPYQSAGAYPEDEDNQRQLAFERALDDLSDDNGLSELMQVTLGMGKKQWLYYTCDRPRFMNEINARLAGHERYPLAIEFYEDPEWQIWAQAVQQLTGAA